MEELFKQKLLSLRQPPKAKSFAEALCGVDLNLWPKKIQRPVGPEVHTPPTYSEKTQVIESLERFTKEKAESLGSNSVKFTGGEILLKSEPSWEDVTRFTDMEMLRASLKLDSRFQELVLSQKIPGEVKVLFITEKFRNWDEISSELQTGFINEVLAGFPLKTAELFARMIGAMKLEAKEVLLYPVEGMAEEDYSQEVMEIAAFLRPEVVITLGAKATQKILKNNDRLSLVHGQFFPRKLAGTGTIQIVPLFHPSIIETNQNMKKTAWTDMQKIMKFLKKLP